MQSFNETESNSESPKTASDQQSVKDLLTAGDDAFIWSKSDTRFPDAIKCYKQALEKDPKNGRALFRLGVVYRARYDSSISQSSDFDLAVKNWTAATNTNPNQYIWQRRIQQYGPRQTKPYPFYDWVEQAIADIKAQGNEPVKLKVPLSGAEVSEPNRTFVSDPNKAENPDPENKITSDDGLIKIDSTVVPAEVKKGDSVRVFFRLSPVRSKWNNEGQPMRIWINEASNGETSQRLLEFATPDSPESTETRTVEFEFQTDAAADPCQFSGFVLYSVCESESGQCFFSRRNFEFQIPVRE